jgi:hypothetical protein
MVEYGPVKISFLGLVCPPEILIPVVDAQNQTASRF